jgi:hypothetical protein
MSQGVDNQDTIAGGNQHTVLGKRFLGAAGLPGRTEAALLQIPKVQKPETCSTALLL